MRTRLFFLLVTIAVPGVDGIIRTLKVSGVEQQIAAEQPSRNMWPLFPPGFVPGEAVEQKEMHVLPDLSNWLVQYCVPGDMYGSWYVNVSYPQLDPYLVEGADTGVIILPGGGHEFLDWNKEGTDVATWLNSLGISAFILKYRVPSTKAYIKAVQDAQRAVSLVRSRAGEYGLNRSRIGIMGFSAGGLIATQLLGAADRTYAPSDAVDDQPYKPDFQLLIYARIDKHSIANLTRPPPTFIATAQDDPCVQDDELMQYFLYLERYGVEHSELHVFPDGGHGYGLCSGYPSRWYEVYMGTQCRTIP